MNRIYIVTILFLSLSISNTFGQFSYSSSIIDPYDFYHILQNSAKTKIDLSSVEGSPYEQETFVLGKAAEKLTNNSMNYYLRYNVYNDEIQMKINLDDEKIVGLIKSLNHYAIINNKEYHYMSYSDNNKNINEGYFILISNDIKSSIYLKKIVKFKIGQPERDSFRKAIPSAFKNFEKFYYQKDRVLFQLPTKKKEILLLFSDKKEDLKKFMKAEKINLKDEKDLIKLFKYYDSLNN
jgi:hypothetical protein